MENENEIFNDENKNIFAAIGKNLTSVYTHMLKHLNRYHKWTCYVPQWISNKWVNKYRIDVTEVNGVIDNREAERNLKLKKNELGDKQYRIVFRIFDNELKQFTGYGFAEDRKDFFKIYIQNINKSIQLRKLQTGCDAILT